MSNIRLYYANYEKAENNTISYDPAALEEIEEVVVAIKTKNPWISDIESRVREVILRYRGDACLSAARVNKITAAIMYVIENSVHTTE